MGQGSQTLPHSSLDSVDIAYPGVMLGDISE